MRLEKKKYPFIVPLFHTKTIFKTIFFLYVTVQLGANAKAQSAPKTPDTLSLAKQMREHHQIPAALALLQHYTQQHPNELNGIWVYAQTAFWANDFALSNTLFEKAIAMYPSNLYLQLDFANTLLQMADIEKAKKYYLQYLAYDSTHAGSLTGLATIAYWQGHYHDALQIIEKVEKLYPDDNVAKAKAKEIRLASAFWLSVSHTYNNDDQPLICHTPSLSVGWGRSHLVNPFLKIETPSFTGKGTAVNFSAGNQFQFAPTTRLSTAVGAVKFVDATTTFNAAIKLQQGINKNLSLEVVAERLPYFFALASVDTAIIMHRLHTNLSFSNKKGWLGKASVESNFFEDNNAVISASAWALAPVVQSKKLQLHLGYSFQFNSSSESRYQPYNYTTTSNTISGLFTPYFTPKSMQAHLALASINWSPNTTVQLKISGSYGFYGTLENPYLYLDAATNGGLIVKRGFASATFHPIEMACSMTWQANEKTSFQVGYAYKQTFFYTLHQLNAGLKVFLWNEKK